MEKKTEKRSVSRVPIHESVSFEMTERDSGRFRNVLGSGMGVDISRLGIGLSTDNPLSRGDVLRINFPVSVTDISLPVYTEVMWSVQEDGKFRAGLRFLA